MQHAGLTRRTAINGLASAVLTGLGPSHARAQAPWPSQAIKLIVPFPPGGSTDLLARIIGQKIEPLLGKPVVIENRAGAGGVPAATAVARAEPDGHTLMMGHIGTLAFNPSLYPNLGYDPNKDFIAVARVAAVPNILVVHPSLPVQTTQELITHIKANPGKFNYGSGGNGSNAHISMAYFAHSADLDLVHVPYRGTAPAVNDLVGNHVQVVMTGGPAVLPLAAAGQLRALGVSSTTRVDYAPNLPPIADAVPGFESVQWYGIVAPAKTPPAIVDRLNQLVNAQLAAPEVVENLRKDGAIAAPGTAAAFGAQIAAEIISWREIITRANIRISQ
jgi:tripartite-type tricarboxylate transporter receptor subunit TctC